MLDPAHPDALGAYTVATGGNLLGATSKAMNAGVGRSAPQPVQHARRARRHPRVDLGSATDPGPPGRHVADVLRGRRGGTATSLGRLRHDRHRRRARRPRPACSISASLLLQGISAYTFDLVLDATASMALERLRTHPAAAGFKDVSETATATTIARPPRRPTRSGSRRSVKSFGVVRRSRTCRSISARRGARADRRQRRREVDPRQDPDRVPHKPDAGRIFLYGEEVQLKSVTHARSLGIDTVFQDLALVPGMTVYHNMFLNREITPAWGRSASSRTGR